MADILNFTGRRKERPPEAPFDYEVEYESEGEEKYPPLLTALGLLAYSALAWWLIYLLLLKPFAHAVLTTFSNL